MGPTWVLSAPDGPHFGPMNLAIMDVFEWQLVCKFGIMKMNFQLICFYSRFFKHYPKVVYHFLLKWFLYWTNLYYVFCTVMLHRPSLDSFFLTQTVLSNVFSRSDLFGMQRIKSGDGHNGIIIVNRHCCVCRTEPSTYLWCAGISMKFYKRGWLTVLLWWDWD